MFKIRSKPFRFAVVHGFKKLTASGFDKCEALSSIRHIVQFLLPKYHCNRREKTLSLIRNFVDQRRRHVPLQYIFGEWQFRRITLLLRPPVLIPRPETEQIIDIIGQFVTPSISQYFLEIGCGSGAISLSLLHEFPAWSGLAIDITRDSIELTTLNSKLNRLSRRLELRETSFQLFQLKNAPQKFDFIVSNPPYIRSQDISSLSVEVRDFESHVALDGGPDGLCVIFEIISNAKSLLNLDGPRLLFLEIGYDQKQSITEYVSENVDRFGVSNFFAIQDYLGYINFMFQKQSAKKQSLFSAVSNGSSCKDEAVMKDLAFRLIVESPKAKLRYGTLRDALKKPAMAHVSPSVPRCSCSTQNICFMCRQLASLRNRYESLDNTSAQKWRPSLESMDLEDLNLCDTPELSFGVKENDSDSSEEETTEVADVLQSLFHQADKDARVSAMKSLKQYRHDLVYQQQEHFKSVFEEIQAHDSAVLSNFAERRNRLAIELSHAENTSENPTSPVSDLIKRMEEHRIGRVDEFRNRLKSVHAATLRSTEIETHRNELSTVVAKLLTILDKIEKMSLNMPLKDPITETRTTVTKKVSDLQSLDLNNASLESALSAITDGNRLAEFALTQLREYENSNLKAAAPTIDHVLNAPTDASRVIAIPVNNSQTSFAEAKNYVEAWRARLKPFMDDPNFKQQRSDLQRGVFSLVNMLSSESELSARISVKLNQLLDGQEVEIAGRKVTAQCHPQGADFIKLAICKKLIGQAEEEVSSQPSIAIPLAKAFLPLVLTRFDMAKLMVSFFYSSCPMLVPLEIGSAGNTNIDSMLEELGYKKRADGEFEGIERFLKRMSGIATLFSSLAVVPVATPPNGVRPITMATIWSILVRLSKMTPIPDLTPTIVYELLKGCSKQLHASYGKQFNKLARSIKIVFLSKLDSSAGSVSTLRHFINTEVAAICNWPLAQP